MKNIFIGGVAKSGKSRLAKYIYTNNKINHIPMDYFTSSFKHTFPSLGITSNVVIDRNSSKLLAKFLKRFIEIAEESDEFFIIDSAHIYPSDIIEYLDREKWDIYYLGYPNTTEKDKIEEINQYVSGGWIEKKSEEELLNIFKSLINISKEIEDECKKYNIEFIDTSKEDVLEIMR